MRLQGNIVTPQGAFLGEISWENRIISAVEKLGELQPDAPWILPGFIEIHLHGCGEHNVEEGEKGLRGMAEFLLSKGTTRFLPAYSCAPKEEMLDFLKTVRQLMQDPPPGAILAGACLEGPWLNPRFCGGMIPEMIRPASCREAQEYLDAAAGTLKLMTIAPELPGAMEVMKLMQENGVRLSLGHSACPVDLLDAAIEAGLSEITHLFDSYELPEDHGGVRQVALTDRVLVEDRLMKEIIMDGLHVPPGLVILARRAAGAKHIIAITDALQGAGLKEGHFLDCGKPYVIREDDLARREEDGQIIGSALTMNRAFHNMTEKFGFSPEEAVCSLSENPAKQLGISHLTGKLEPGFLADIVELGADRLNVAAVWQAGEQKYGERI